MCIAKKNCSVILIQTILRILLLQHGTVYATVMSRWW